MMLRRLLLGFVLALLATVTAYAEQATGTRWVMSWAASPQPRWEGDFPLPVLAPPSLWNQTVRQRIRLSLGGARIRLVLSNRYGDTPATIGAASVARAGTPRPVMFGGKASVSIPPGASAVSDALELDAPALSELAVSLYFPRPTAISTFHWEGLQSAPITEGDLTAQADFQAASTTTTRIVLSGVMVEAPAAAGTIVAFGDSITDGAASTPDANHRWPDFLAAKLAPLGLSVVNAGISGNRLLHTRMGESALARFDRDVASVPDVKAVVVLIGINDISWPGHVFAPDLEMPSVDEMIEGYRQLAALAHARNIGIIGATLTPFEGALGDTPFRGYYTPEKERLRQELNAWVRSGGAFDAVVDLDAALRDPENGARLRAAFDSGDHLHASDAGNEAIADAVAAVLHSAGILK